jgi:hypothetical protein
MTEEAEPIVIELGTTGLVAWIDEEDRELAENHSWGVRKAGTKEFPHYYASYRWNSGVAQGEEFLHNEVWERKMGAPVPRGFLVDHINRDKLDCRRDNLRLARRSDNEANKGKRRTQKNAASGQCSSQYKGVTHIKGRKKPWRATISKEKRSRALGYFYDEKDAAKAYNKAALELFGEFASINEFDEEIEND